MRSIRPLSIVIVLVVLTSGCLSVRPYVDPTLPNVGYTDLLARKSPQPLVLNVDFQRNGRTVKGLIDVARNGYMWFLERGTGPIRFIQGVPHVRQNVFRSLDPVTGKPDVDPARKPGTGKVAEFCPSHWGGKNWPPIAYSPQTRLVYVPANENLCATINGDPQVKGGRSTLLISPGADHIGEVQAWNVDTHERVWTHKYATSPTWGSMLVTGSGLVFTGGTNDRKFHALDAATGKLLWEFPTNSGILAPPTSFMLDGKQYIATISGNNLVAFALRQ